MRRRRLTLLKVLCVERLTPPIQRIVLGGDELQGFVSSAPEDYVKLFFPNSSGEIVPPVARPNGATLPPGHDSSPKRDYTPRQYDRRYAQRRASAGNVSAAALSLTDQDFAALEAAVS